MGTEICCMKTRTEIYPIKQLPKISNGFPQVDDTTIKIIKIQSAIRVYLSKNKLNSLFLKTISEIKTESKYSVYPTRWYLNIQDAELAQLMCRSEHVEKLKKAMENAQNAFADAIQRYAFAEPSTPKEL